MLTHLKDVLVNGTEVLLVHYTRDSKQTQKASDQRYDKLLTESTQFEASQEKQTPAAPARLDSVSKF
ncbi:UNKNOWN [Stylonychia lemnae]|uniref:Uncharacterized protein n=1 Tax=Stylonychia lemnae TaxID=5949 RepID=A0A078AH56_STYLE|nr:UNKNOWN [Stylonychia lemnae]|eukprot:CDW81615.1 UNKNOWN [Stylonychia lemnae]